MLSVVARCEGGCDTQHHPLVPRESIYQRLSQTSPDNTNKNITQYSIDPTTRYPNLNLQAITPSQVLA